MGRRSLQLLIFLFVCTHLIISSAAFTLSRVRRLLERVRESPFPSESVEVSIEKKAMEEASGNARMELEINDYPGSGANDRHTPPSQGN